MTLETIKAIILSAGYGTRLHPLTEILPKALVPLAGKPLIRHTIERLLTAGISSIGINTHHHAARMQNFAAEQHDCSLHLSHEPELLGSAGGIRGFQDFLNKQDYFLACNADSVSNILFKQYLPDFFRHSPLVMLLLHDCGAHNNVCINSSGAVIDMRDTLRPADVCARLAYTGTAFMSSEFLKLIPPGASELVPLLLKLIETRPGSVRAAVAENIVWRDIGTPLSYMQAHREIMLQRIPLIPDCNMPRQAIHCGERTVIGKGCTLNGFVSIGSGCRVEPGCDLRDCIIWDTTAIPTDTKLHNTICTPEFMINV